MLDFYRLLPSLNEVRLIKNKIFFSTLSEKNTTFAFYLYHVYKQDRIEKQVYKNENHHRFKMDVIDGFYRGVFFRKGQNIRSSHSEEYFLIQSNQIKKVDHFVIREETGFIISNYDIGSDITFIVFQVTGSNKKTAPFGLEFLLLQGVNVISCNQDNNHYQDLSFNLLEELLVPYIDGKKVFLYGSSLAGYCAVYYAGAVNGRAIAAAPRLSIHPDMQRLFPDKSYQGEYKHKAICENKKSDYAPVIFIDPQQERDIYFFDKYIKDFYTDTIVFEFNYAGHEVLTHIMRTRQLTKIIRKIISGQEKELIEELDFHSDTEFSFLEKANDSLKKMNANLNELLLIKNKHVSVQKKLPLFRKKIEKILKKMELFE